MLGTVSLSLLVRLREETRPWHDRLERELDLLRPDFSLEQYRELLARFYGFYAPWEHLILPIAEQWPPLRGRRKLPLLAADLAFVKCEADGLPLCPVLPALRSLSEVLGSMYVVEGATLGGQLLTRHFREHFGFAEDGCWFFAGYGARTSARWREFREVLEAEATDGDASVASANETFACLHSWLTR